MASKAVGFICSILCVHGAALPSKQVQIEPARKLLAQAIASGPMSTALDGGTQKQGSPLLSGKLVMIIVPSLFTISAAIIYFCRRNPNSAELSADVPNNIACNCYFSIIGALFSVT